MRTLKDLMQFEHFEHEGKVPLSLYHGWSTHSTKGSVSSPPIITKMMTQLLDIQIMAVALTDMVFHLRFLCTPIDIESVEKFQKRVMGMKDDEVEEAHKKLAMSVLQTMEQKEAIPSVLSKTLLKNVDDSYIHHVSTKFGFFGSQKGSKPYMDYQKGFKEYGRAVEEAFAAKVSSVQSDETESEDLRLINDKLVVKWHWIMDGLFMGHTWGVATQTPLLTETVIKHMDELISPIEDAFEEVR
jgi:hypothetical protein